MENLFLFIIWNRAYNKKDKIIADIDNCFVIHKIMEIEWSEKCFSENLTRFYGENLPANCNKEQDVGSGAFTLVVVEDKTPVYELRKTTRGTMEKVNIHMFDKKKQYRSWTGINHSRIHGSNSPVETKHDLTLLLGLNPPDFMRMKSQIPNKMKKDLVGAHGWKSVEQLFYVLNETCNYAVLRNFEGLPNSFFVSGHDDIDLLVEDFENVARICKSRPVYKNDYRVQMVCRVAKKKIQMDLRYIGDSYYDVEWEKEIIKNRVKVNGIYIPDDNNYKYMLLYHALVHKEEVKRDYKKRLDQLFGEGKWSVEKLSLFMNENKYRYCEPRDLSVGFNYKIIGAKISLIRRLYNMLVKHMN